MGNRRKSPSYDELSFQNEGIKHRSSSKERLGSVQDRDYSLPHAKDYSVERFSADDDRGHKTEKRDKFEGSRSRRSSSRNREYSAQIVRDYTSERFPVKEEDRGHSERRRESSQDRPHCLLSPSEWQKLPRHSKHSPVPSDRSEVSASRYRRSSSRERSPKYRRHESFGEHAEQRLSSRDDESRLNSFEKRSYERDERSPSRSEQDVSHSMRSPPRKERDHFYDRRTSPMPERGLPVSPVKRELPARNRRSTSRDRRYVEGRESNKADHSCRSPSQTAASQRSATQSRSRNSFEEELERLGRRRHSPSTDACSRSPVCKRRRESSERRPGSRDRRSRSGSRESSRSPDGRKYHRSRSDKREDSRSRRGSYSPASQPFRESQHSNRDIVQFLMDTGIIRASKSDSKCHDSGGSAVRIPVAKSPTSVASAPALATHSVAGSVATTAAPAQVTTLSSSGFISSYPVVPPPAIMPCPVVPQMPYVDNASVPYMACNPYPAAFPAAPAAAPSPWYPQPVMQPCSSFPNPVPNQAAPVPYPVIQPIQPAAPAKPSLLGPGPPPVIQQCPVPGIPSTPAQDWQASYSRTYNRFPEPMNQSSFRQMEDHMVKPRPTYGTDMNAPQSILVWWTD